MTLIRSLFVSLLLLSGFWSPGVFAASGEEEEEFLRAEEAFQPVVERTGSGWHVRFDIADHYYLYQSRIKLKKPLEGDQVSFRQTAELKNDPNFGEVLIYHDVVDVDVTVTAEGDRVLSYQGCAEAGLCYPPQKLTLSAALAVTEAAPATASAPAADSELGGESLFWVVLSFLGLGIGLSLTPCVFPMIPILSSIIVGQSGAISARRGFTLALSYVVGMASSYAMIGILVAAFGAQLNIGALTQTPAVIIGAALLFIFLSLPMFGLFELQLPAVIRNRLNDMQSRQKGGALLSTFVMGFFAALVVSPCVSAPLAGALVYLSSTGDVLTGGSALFAMGLGMGGPLLLIGLSGGKLLPKAGTWMLLIKGAFGVGLLAVAISLLDRILPGQIILLLSGALAIGCGVYLGALESSADNKARLARIIGILSLLTGAGWWLGAGMGNDSLLRPLAISASPAVVTAHAGADHVVVDSRATLEKAIAASAAQGRKVLVDVYADWCTSCRDVDRLLAQPAVVSALSGYDVIRFDITEGSDDQTSVLADWQVFGPPALQRFDQQGLKQGAAIQGVPAETELIDWL